MNFAFNFMFDYVMYIKMCDVLKLINDDVSNKKFNLNQNHFDNITKFQSKLICDENTAFYPLSGIDFPHLYYFYPNAKKYIMIGMENLGIIPNNADDYSDYSNDAIKLLEEYNITQYFSRTGMKMAGKSQHQNSRLGLMLLVFVTIIGFVVDEFDYINLNKNGDVVSSPNVVSSTNGGMIIKFHKKNETIQRELIYLNMELTGNLNISQVNFFDKQKTFNMFLKASEYSLQMNKFSETVDYLLSKTNMVIQDDSGIAYEIFNDEYWEIKLYGNYIGRIEIPHTAIVYSQSQLLKDFKSKTIEDLPFEFGYPYGFGAMIRLKNPGIATFYGSDITQKPSNLMVIRRKSMLSTNITHF